jgi:hypothetical protein
MMHEALKKWNALPPADKTAKVPDHGKLDAKFHRSLPEKAQVIKVITRALEKNGSKYSHLKDKIPGKLAAVDHLWLRQEEIQQLHSLVQSGGGSLNKRLTHRIARYHFTDSTRGEPPFWKLDEIKNLIMKVDKTGIISGSYHLETEDANRGYQGKLSGRIGFTNNGKLSGFELLALGNHWGEGRYTRGARPGKSPLGIFMQHIATPQAAELIPPQGIHWEKGYWQAEKH